jgi:serine/threonine-protein phosphatase CPPED1
MFARRIAVLTALLLAVAVGLGLAGRPAVPAAQAAEYLRILKKLGPAIRAYSLPGNHDVGNEPTPESLAAERWSPPARSACRSAARRRG